jgi:hypothetical protein
MPVRKELTRRKQERINREEKRQKKMNNLQEKRRRKMKLKRW